MSATEQSNTSNKAQLMTIRPTPKTIAVIASLTLAACLAGSLPPVHADAPDPKASQKKAITDALRSADPARRQKAIADIRAWFAADPAEAADAYYRQWRDPLRDLKDYKDRDEFSADALNAGPQVAWFAADLQRDRISDLFATGQIDAGLTAIHKHLITDPYSIAGSLANDYLKVLLSAKRYNDVVALAPQAIVNDPEDTGATESALQARIAALTALGKFDDALADAKRYYNVASMNDTGNALLAVVRQLQLARPNDLQVIDQFRTEQIAGALLAAAATPADSSPARDGVLASIKVDPHPYLDAANAIDGEDFDSLSRRVNLLLIAGEPAEAERLADRAYTLANDDHVQQAAEAIGRAMKAQDGTIGRANAWILSLRPKR